MRRWVAAVLGTALAGGAFVLAGDYTLTSPAHSAVAGDTARVTALMIGAQCTDRAQLTRDDDWEAACDAAIRAAYQVMDPDRSQGWELVWDAERDAWDWTHAPGGSAGTVTVDLDRLPSPDCWYEIGRLDDDAMPQGHKSVKVESLCP